MHYSSDKYRNVRNEVRDVDALDRVSLCLRAGRESGGVDLLGASSGSGEVTRGRTSDEGDSDARHVGGQTD